MREVKDPEVRRAEIMEASKLLFYQKGYLNTTTQDIIKSLRISRGLLYYHFKSKEDILFSIVENHIEPLISRFHLITNNNDLVAKKKVVAFIESTIISESSVQQEDYALQDAIELPENDYMIDRINHKLSYVMTEYFTKIIEQGNSEGVFNVDYPKETATFLMTAYSFVMNDTTLHNNDYEKAIKYFESFKQLLNRTLGVDKSIFED